MEVFEAVRLLWVESLVVVAAIFAFTEAWEMGSILFMAVSFALIGMAVGVAGLRYEKATTV